MNWPTSNESSLVYDIFNCIIKIHSGAEQLFLGLKSKFAVFLIHESHLNVSPLSQISHEL